MRRRRAGRSAVIAINWISLWWASRMAGWKFAAALPLVQNTTAGEFVALEIPSARNAALLSSILECNLTLPA